MDKQGKLCGTMVAAKYPAVRRKDFPWLAYVAFLYEGRPLPTSEEMQRFDVFEDVILRLESTEGVFHFGTMTTNGKRDYMFQCRDREEAARLFLGEASFSGAQIEFQWDPRWLQHRDLLGMKG